MDNKTKHDLDKAINIINNLIDGIAFLPQSWDDMLTFDISEDIKEFMREHDPENWGSQPDQVRFDTP